MKLIKFFLIPLFIFSNLHAETDEAKVMSLIQSTIDEIVVAVDSLPGEAKRQERRDKIREAINPRFDFEEMAKRSLGPEWAGCTPEQQKEFVNVFSELLAKTYMNKVESIKKDTVKLLSAEIKENKALVKTKVLYNEDTFPLDYKMLQQGSNWRVYDVVIENIGLVVNYRNEFAGIIRKEGIEGLIIKLKDKLLNP